MFTVFNSESLWIGTDLKRFNEIRDILDSQNIKYKYKVKDQLGEWTGSGTIRGRVGSAGNPAEQAKQYEILVDRKNLEQAFCDSKMIRYFYKTPDFPERIWCLFRR